MKRFMPFYLFLFVLFSCSKQELLSKTSIEDLAGKGKPITNLLPGTCPYDCHDTRCKAYYNGYCGPTTPTPDTLTVVSNPNNPNEASGKTHNKGMYSIMPNYDYGILKPTEQNVTSYRLSFLNSQGYTTTSINQIDSLAKNYFGDMYNDTSITWTVNTSFQSNLISTTVKTYLNQLNTSVKNFFYDSVGIPTQSEYNTFANNLITTENQVNNSSTISATDKTQILSCYAVARYSALYNINYSIQHQSSGGTARFLAWLNLKDVVGSDIAGAAAGVAIGWRAAVITGGAAGPLIAEAVADWSIGCSVYSGAYQAYTYYTN